jgi:hypothetical protein
MSLVLSREFLADVSVGNVPGFKLVNKFGHNPAVAASTIEDIWRNGGVYTWPQSASTLEVISDDAADTAAGNGARGVTIEGLDENWDEVSETVATAGLSPSSPTSTTFIRVNRAYVSTVGTYCSTTTTANGANAGNITVRISSAGATQCVISDGSAFGLAGVGQSQIARYTIPDTFRGLLLSYNITINANKATDMFFFARQNADDVSAPMDPKRIRIALHGLSSPIREDGLYMDAFAARTDVWWCGYGGAGDSDVAVDFQMLLCPA